MSALTGLAAEYEQATKTMEALRDGKALRDAAASVQERLPSGPLVLMSTSPEGTAVAAVCAASRPSTTWQFLHLACPPAVGEDEHIVFIEPVDPGRGWRAAVRRRYPRATLLFVETAVVLEAA